MFIGRVSPSDRINKSFSPFSVAFSIRTPLNSSEWFLIARRRKRGRKEVVHNSDNGLVVEGDLRCNRIPSCTTIGSSGCAACKRNLITFVDKLESLELQNKLVFKIASFADPDDAVAYVGIY